MADTSTGWVRLYRSFTQWGWYSDINVRCVYLHLILTANHKDTEWHGIQIKRGQLVTSYRHLSNEIGLDLHTVHDAIKKLKKTGEITAQPNAKFTIITLNNYNSFQNTPTIIQQSSNDSPTIAQPNNNVIMNNNENKNNSPAAKADTPTGKRLERRF